MPLPDNFSPAEHLTDQILRVHNKRVSAYFKSTPTDSIDTPKASLRLACTMRDDDSIPMMAQRQWLFEVIVGNAQSLHPPLYSTPSLAFQDHAKFKPQVSLFFREDPEDVDAGYSPITAEISVRLMNLGESITNAELKSLALKIKSLFSTGNGFTWRKGKKLFAYTETEKGYRLKILATTEAEAKKVIEQILDIQSHSPKWSNLNLSEATSEGEKYPTIPAKETILGKSRRMPRRRPVGTVRFQYAVAHIWGLPNPIPLVDRTYRYKEPLAP